MKFWAFLTLLALLLPEAGPASLPKKERKRREEQSPEESKAHAVPHVGHDVPSVDDYHEVIDLSSYEEDYGDQLPEVELSSAAPPAGTSPARSTVPPRTPSPTLTGTRPTAPGRLHSLTSGGLPTCLVCVCLGSSVYCDDADLDHLPPLPRTTAYLYARFNRITHVGAGAFQGLTKLKRIDLSGNLISSIDAEALHPLPALQDLILSENRLAALPPLPRGTEILDVRRNRLRSSGIQPEAFGALERLQFLYLADNLLDAIPGPLPLSLRSLHLQNNRIDSLQRGAFCDPEEHRHTRRPLEDIRLDHNPINLSLFPEAYFCLPRLPIGRFT
ncbi:opticin [Perognathus longimembris pacificus]|uniref:opticin n=1 Tax=Perognathus longimembris pacificus TaxID=214514 RepID=UPI002018E900|nr:opticin [Perognathus longimembris pacificus]